MFCPNCGAGEQKVKTYCKRCGQWLPDLKSLARSEFGGASPQENALMVLFMSALSGVFALFCGILLYYVHAGRPGAHWSVFMAAAFCMAIASWQFSSFFIGLKLLRRLRRGRKAEGVEDKSPALADATPAASSLGEGNPAQFVEVRSVTEGPTQLFEHLPRRGEGGRRTG